MENEFPIHMHFGRPRRGDGPPLGLCQACSVRATHGQHTVNTTVNTATFVRKVANIKPDFDYDAGALLKHLSFIVIKWAAGTVEFCFAFTAAFS